MLKKLPINFKYHFLGNGHSNSWKMIRYSAGSPENFCGFFLRTCLGISHWKMVGIFSEFFLVSVSHEMKHENSKNSGKIRSKIRGKIRDKFEKIGELSFCNFSDLMIRRSWGPKRWKTNGEKMVDFWCRFFTVCADLFTVYKGHKRWKKNISLLMILFTVSFSRFAPSRGERSFWKRNGNFGGEIWYVALTPKGIFASGILVGTGVSLFRWESALESALRKSECVWWGAFQPEKGKHTF